MRTPAPDMSAGKCNPLVSVVMPAFRAETTLAEAVESCLSQTFANLEVLIVDDGSDDGTLDVAHKCQKSDSHRVRVLQHPQRQNLGVAASRNLALAHSNGGYIAFLDADDAWLPEKTERQLHVLTCNDDIGFVFSDVFLSVNPKPGLPMAEQRLEPDPFRATMSELFNADATAGARILSTALEPYRFIPSPTPLIRRSVLRDAPGFIGPPSLSLQYEDYLMWRILSTRTRLFCLQEPLAIYRVHEGSFTGQFHATRSVVDHLVALEEVQDIFLKHCGSSLDSDCLGAMFEAQKERIVRRAHKAPWSQMLRLIAVAERYGVRRAVIERRLRALSAHARARISTLLHSIGPIHGRSE